jgi:hypothetical protein
MNVMEKNRTEFTLAPIVDGIEDILGVADDVDAVYLGFLGQFEGAEKSILINSYDDIQSFQADYIIIAGNSPKPFKGNIPIIFELE